MSFFLLQDKSLNGAKAAGKKLSLEAAGITEDKLRDLIADQINECFPDENLFLIATEYKGWQDIGRSLDILAVDSDANFVVIEIKRDNKGAHAELQALRYAALLSVCTLDNVLDAGIAYRKKLSASQDIEAYKKELVDFLMVQDETEIAFGEIPRIFLVSSDFKKDLTTTVIWLNEQFGKKSDDSSGIEISCFQSNIFTIDTGNILCIDQIIPIPNTSDYQVKARAKFDSTQIAVAAQKSKRGWIILEKNKILKLGIEIEYINVKQIPDLAPEDTVAIYQGGGKYEWNSLIYPSLNAVTKALWKKYGLDFGNVQTPKYWRRKGSTQSLSDEAGT